MSEKGETMARSLLLIQETNIGSVTRFMLPKFRFNWSAIARVVRYPLPYIACGALLFVMACVDDRSVAQDAAFPSRSIRIIVPYPPGGSTDITTRSMTEEAAKILKQPVIIENRPGGGTVVGTQAARNAPADGYTLLFQSNALITNVLALKQPGYQISDFVPVAIMAASTFTLIVPSKSLLSTLPDLVAYAKQNPGKLNYATLGHGTSSHILGNRLGMSAKFSWVDIPYKGAVEASNAILAGDVDAFLASQFAGHAMLQTGKARILAVASKTRVGSLPDVPTFAELGYPDINDEGAYVIFARSETPPDVVQKLRASLDLAVRSREFQTRREAQGLSQYNGTVDDYAKDMQANLLRLTEEFKQLRISPQ